MISFGPLDPHTEIPAILAASAAHFGPDSYQCSPAYLDWLYRANPAARGYGDCIVARQAGEIVGCMHRMMLPLTAPHGAYAALHNHFMAKNARSGPGVLLLRRATKDADIALAPGVQAPLDEMYRRLGFVEHQGFWLMRNFDPVAAGVQHVRSRLMGSRPPRFSAARLAAEGLMVTASPDDALLGLLCQSMREAGSGAATIDWTPELVRWRYFDPGGPRHLLLARDSAMAVIALGTRRGVTVARLLEITRGADAAFIAAACRAARGAGAAIGLAFTTNAATAALLTQTRWGLRDNATFSFRTGDAPLVISGGATDVGFEAFGTDIR